MHRALKKSQKECGEIIQVLVIENQLNDYVLYNRKQELWIQIIKLFAKREGGKIQMERIHSGKRWHIY